MNIVHVHHPYIPNRGYQENCLPHAQRAAGHDVTIVTGTVLLGVGLSWPGVVIARFMDHLERSEHGTEFGLLQTVLLLVSSLGSGVTGALADRAGWLSAYGLSAALLAALVVLLAVKLLHDRWRGHPVV